MLKTLKTYYRFLAKKKGWFWLFIALLITDSTVRTIRPYFYKLFVDKIPDGNYNELLIVLAASVVVMLMAVVTSNFARVVGDYLMLDAPADLRSEVVKRIHDLDFTFHSNKSTGSMISAIKRGDGAYFNMFHSLHFNLLGATVAFVVGLYFFGTVDYRIALIIFASIVVSLFVTKFIIGFNLKARRKFIKEEDKVSSVIVDNLINFETVKLFAMEGHERSRLAKLFKLWKNALWKFALSFRLFDIVLGLISIASIAAVLWLSLYMTTNNKMTIGEFVLVVGFMWTIYPKLFDLIWNFRTIAKSYADIERYFGYLDYEVEVKDPSSPVKIGSVNGEVEFGNVWFTYKEGKNKKNKAALRGIDLKIRQGQSVALVGRSGSGKTSLTKLLMRFYDLDRGKITIDGVDIKRFTKSNLRSFMGVVPQEPILFNNTIAYNIGYGDPKASKREIEAAAKMANLHKFISGLPRGYATSVGERGIKLSGGQKQRLAIARMMLSNPEIIIFDEATSQLDSENEKLIQEAFWKASEDKTTIVIAHRLSTAMRTDKIIVMEEGKIVETGSHKALLARKKSLYRYFWGLQTNVDE